MPKIAVNGQFVENVVTCFLKDITVDYLQELLLALLKDVISNDLRVTSIELAKYSMTRSIARSLCDS